MQSQSLVQSAPLMDQASTQNQSRDAPIDRLIQHLNQVSEDHRGDQEEGKTDKS